MTSSYSRRAALALFAAAGLLGSCAREGSGKLLRVGSQRGGTKAMMLASGALEGAEYAVEWSEFPAAQHLLEALAAQAVDLGTVGDAPFLFAYAAGKPIKVVQATRFAPRNVATAVLLPKRSTIAEVASLRGRTVVTGRGSIGHFLLLRALERAHVPARQVNIVFMSPGDATAAFDTGAVDAWATWNPYVGAAMLHAGARVLVDGRRVIESYGFMVAAEQAIRTRLAILGDFLERHARAQSWASANRDAYADLLARETGLPIGDARYFADRDMAVTAIDASLIARQRSVLATFVGAGVVIAGRRLEEAFDNRFDNPS